MSENLKPTKGRGGKNNFPAAQIPDTEPGDNTKYLSHAMQVMNLPPINKKDPEQVRSRIYEYFTLCTENDVKPTVKGFLNALKMPRQTLWEWKQGNHRADTHQAIILEAYDMLEALWEDYMMNGKINPVSGIFLGKNNFGYQDKQEYVVTPNTNAISEVDIKAIEDKYSELPND
jgi:hypothetical protein